MGIVVILAIFYGLSFACWSILFESSDSKFWEKKSGRITKAILFLIPGSGMIALIGMLWLLIIGAILLVVLIGFANCYFHITGHPEECVPI